MNVDYETMRLNDGVYDILQERGNPHKKALTSYMGVVYYTFCDNCNKHDGSYQKKYYSFKKVGEVPKEVIDLYNKEHKIQNQSDKVKELSNFLYNSVKLNMSETTLRLLVANYFLDKNLMIENR